MANLIEKTYAPSDEDADGYVDGATGATSPLTMITNSVADGFAHKVSITSPDNISGVNFTITGTDENGDALVEVVTGPNATTVFSAGYFLTVTSVAISATLSTNTADVGWADEFVTPGFALDVAAKALFQTIKSGTLNYTVQFSLVDPNRYPDNDPEWGDMNDPVIDLTSITVSTSFSTDPTPYAVRIVFNSYSSGASLKVKTIQSLYGSY